MRYYLQSNTLTDIVKCYVKETHIQGQDVELEVEECIYPQTKDGQLPVNFAVPRLQGETASFIKLTNTTASIELHVERLEGRSTALQKCAAVPRRARIQGS